MRRTPPSTISIPYSDMHRVISPSSLNTANFYDNQCTSLFGDPVPPPNDNFFEDLDKNLYGSLRGRSSSIQSNSIVDDFPKANSFATQGDRSSFLPNSRRSPSSRLGSHDSNDLPSGRIFTSARDRLASISPVEDARYSVESSLPGSRFTPRHSGINTVEDTRFSVESSLPGTRYTPVQSAVTKIEDSRFSVESSLPGSRFSPIQSGINTMEDARYSVESSLPGTRYTPLQSGINTVEDSRFSVESSLPGSRYTPLQNGINNRPQLIISPPSQEFDPDNMWDRNISGRNRRRSSELSDEFNVNLEAMRKPLDMDDRPKRIFSKEPLRCLRQGSNESFSSGEWFKPSNDYQEWSKIPRLRPSSKNVMSINQEAGNNRESPLASLIHGSNTSTSSDEKATPDTVKLKDFRDETPVVIISREARKDREIEDTPPKELPPPEAATISKELPLPIVTNAVTTGSNFRANPPRPHKKPSFTILAERSPQSSRPTSPSPGNSGRVSPFLGYGFREASRRKSSQSSQIQLPNIPDSNNNVNTSDDSVRPLVQFDMSSYSGPTMQQSPAKSILQNNAIRPMAPARTKKKPPPIQATNQKMLPKVHSFESLPKIASTSAPKLPSRRSSKTSLELSTTEKFSLPLPNKNPTSRQKGILRVYSSAENSPSRIPVRPNGASSMENISPRRRSSLSPIRKDQRSDSVSSERKSSSLTTQRNSITSDRRSSNLSTVTTSDFSFRRNSISPPKTGIDPNILNVRSVRSSPRSPRRVAKATSLSPIIGTPNKDTQLSTDEQILSDSYSRRSSQTRIPLGGGSRTPSRSNSRVASRSNSRAPSAVNSRTASPSKDFLPISRPNSRVTSRPTSRSSSQADVRIPSRIPSRSNSRSGMYENFDPITKKAASLSPPKSRRVSPSPKKSRSESPRKSPRRSLSPRKSPSPPRTRSLSRSDRRSSLSNKSPPPPKSPIVERRAKSPTPPSNEVAGKTIRPTTRITRIPSKKESAASAKKASNSLKKPEVSVKRSSSLGRAGGVKAESSKVVKKPISTAKKEAASVKSTSSFRREASSLKKEPSNLRKDISKVKKEPSNFKREGSNVKKLLPAGKKDTTSLKREGSNVQRTGSKNLKREVSNVKRTPSNAKRDATTIKREPSNLQRTSSNLKREPSNLNREPSNLKREGSNLKREPSNLKREPSNLKREPSNLRREGSRISLKKTPSNPNMDATAKVGLTKKRSDSSLNKKLEKKNSFRNEKAAAAMADESDASTIPVDSLKEDGGAEDAKTEKLIPLTKANVISMTTAAITAQPVQITTSITNQMPLAKSNSSNQLLSSSDSSTTKADMKDMDPVTILERSQKTLETVQKTVTEATEEIQKTIHENLTDLKSLETDIGRMSDDLVAPFEKSDSLTTVLENPVAQTPSAEAPPAADGEGTVEATTSVPSKSPAPPTQPIEANVSVLATKKSSDNLLHPTTNHNNNNSSSGSSAANGMSGETEDMAERVSERAISVLPEVECESANLQNYELLNEEGGVQKNGSGNNNNNEQGNVLPTSMTATSAMKSQGGGDGSKEQDKGGDTSKRDDSQEYLDDEKPKGCCSRLCSKLCMPCRRCQCCSCCRSKKSGSARSDERIIVEEVNEKRSCWGRCCSCCRKKKNVQGGEARMEQRRMEPIQEERESGSSVPTAKQNKCCLCLAKMFCCKKTNKVETTTEESEEVRKCCFCIPCGKKKKPSNAWQERRESIISDPPPQPGCCTRLCNKIFCCCRKSKPVSESRRTSMNSKKQSIAPTLPPEDSRPKLHNDLVEYNSKMKGAIPVMPICLAWFCMICNCIVPGFGTILSGFFCLCVGIPRFSQYDSAKARIGSLIINCIVGVAQAFCLLFCFVGWGWSIWWGTIMLKTARKLRKIRRVEELEMQEEQRQQAAEKARRDKDVEAQKKDDKK